MSDNEEITLTLNSEELKFIIEKLNGHGVFDPRYFNDNEFSMKKFHNVIDRVRGNYLDDEDDSNAYASIHAKLLSNVVTLNHEDEKGRSIINKLIMEFRFHLIKDFPKIDDINKSDSRGFTPLIACLNSDDPYYKIEELLELYPDIDFNAHGKDGANPLAYCVLDNDEAFDFLVKNGAVFKSCELKPEKESIVINLDALRQLENEENFDDFMLLNKTLFTDEKHWDKELIKEYKSFFQHYY